MSPVRVETMHPPHRLGLRNGFLKHLQYRESFLSGNTFFIIIYQKHRDNDHPHQFPNVLQHRALAGNVPLIMHD